MPHRVGIFRCSRGLFNVPAKNLRIKSVSGVHWRVSPQGSDGHHNESISWPLAFGAAFQEGNSVRDTRACAAVPSGEGERSVSRNTSFFEGALQSLEQVVSRRPSTVDGNVSIDLAAGTVTDSLWDDMGSLTGVRAPEYEFTTDQEAIILELEAAMTKAAMAGLWLALSEVFMTLAFTIQRTSLLDATAGMSDCVNEVVGAALIYVAARSFRKVITTAGNDISCLLNGLEQLSFAFHELGIINVAFAIMQISTAAALWPASTIYIGVLSVLVTFARFLIHMRPELFDEMTTLNEKVEDIVGGLRKKLIGLFKWAKTEVVGLRSVETAPSHTLHADDTPEYEFTRDEEQVFRNIVTALHIATLAKLMQALGETVLMCANVAVNNHTLAFASLFDLLEELSAAGFMSRASLALNRVITTSGRDITNVMEGLGSKSGLARLFNQLAQASMLLCLAQVLQGLFVLLQQVPNSSVQAAVTSLKSLWAGGAAGLLLTFFTMWMQGDPR